MFPMWVGKGGPGNGWMAGVESGRAGGRARGYWRLGKESC